MKKYSSKITEKMIREMDKFSDITNLASNMDTIHELTNQMDARQKVINSVASSMEAYSHTRLFDEQFAAITKTMSPAMDFMDKVTSMNLLNDKITEFSRIIPEMSFAAAIPSYSFINNQIESLTKSAINFEKFSFSSELALKSLSAFSYPSEKLEAALNSYNTVLEGYIPNNSFEDTFIEVFRRVRSADNDKVEGKINSVADDLEKEAQNVPITFLSVEFYISLIITLVIFVYSSNSQDKMESNILDKLSKVENTIIEKLTEQLPQQTDYTYYVVLRAVQLKNKPHSKKSATITFLYQNQKTRLIERKGKWIKVEYFNHISGIHESGW